MTGADDALEGQRRMWTIGDPAIAGEAVRRFSAAGLDARAEVPFH
jgi:hypothetical protein